MKSYDIVGYANTDGGFCLCTKCAEGQKDTLHPIFASDEWDYIPSCDVCNESLDDVNVIE